MELLKNPMFFDLESANFGGKKRPEGSCFFVKHTSSSRRNGDHQGMAPHLPSTAVRLQNFYKVKCGILGILLESLHLPQTFIGFTMIKIKYPYLSDCSRKHEKITSSQFKMQNILRFQPAFHSQPFILHFFEKIQTHV